MENLVYFGGPIITMNDNQPFVEAMGIKGEKIVAVGSLEEVKNKMENSYKLIDLKRCTLLPGFIDSHFHIVPVLFYYIFLNLVDVKSLKELKEQLIQTVNKKKTG